MRKLLQFIRLPNLIIVGLTQYLLMYAVLYPAYQSINLSFDLSHYQFLSLVLATLFITAGGYVINDIYDIQIDQLNKPDKVFTGVHFTLNQSWFIYFGFNLLGMCIALILAWQVGNLKLAMLYPIAAVLLWAYSAYFKRTVLLGNLIVALFCGAVALLILLAERNSLQILNEQSHLGNYVLQVLYWYGAFAFFTTICREIVKDMEDIEGDAKADCRTLPVVFGIQKSKWVHHFFAFLMLGILIYFIQWHFQLEGKIALGAWFLIFFVSLPIIGLIFLLKQSKTKSDFSKISQYWKGIMLAGLLYLPLFYFLIK